LSAVSSNAERVRSDEDLKESTSKWDLKSKEIVYESLKNKFDTGKLKHTFKGAWSRLVGINDFYFFLINLKDNSYPNFNLKSMSDFRHWAGIKILNDSD